MPLTSSVVPQVMARFKTFTAYRTIKIQFKKEQCVSNRRKDLFERKKIFWGQVHFKNDHETAQTSFLFSVHFHNERMRARLTFSIVQVWRALRLIVDSGLHYKGFSRQKALQFFADYAWDESDTALKEVTRYQSAPGQATAYMIGQQHIKKLRQNAKKMLGDKFDLRDFHYHLLSQGSSPLSYLEQSIDAYINCVKNKNDAGCDDILNPSVKDQDAEDEEDNRDQPRRRRHFF